MHGPVVRFHTPQNREIGAQLWEHLSCRPEMKTRVELAADIRRVAEDGSDCD
jgi:hypothetical protein